MRQVFWTFCIVLCSFVSIQSQDKTSKDIFSTHKQAIVKVYGFDVKAGTQERIPVSFGTGFLIANNLIATANHVITRPEDRSKYFPIIEIEIYSGLRIEAIPRGTAPSASAQIQDFGLITPVKTFSATPLLLGSFKDTIEGDALTSIGFPLQMPKPVLLILHNSINTKCSEHRLDFLSRPK